MCRKQANTKAEVKQILECSKPYHNGFEYIDRPYQIDEEELLIWSELCL